MQSLLHQKRHPISSFPQYLRPSKKTLLLILAVASITLLISTLISIWLTRTRHLDLPSLGTINTQGVEAYWDKNLTDKIDEDEKIDWGTLWLGSSTNTTIYLRSISTIPTTLHLTKANLTFYNINEDAIQPVWNYNGVIINTSDYMNLTWNYNGSVVDSSDSIQVTLTLTAEYSLDFIHYLIENDLKCFSLDILIRTTEYTP